MNEQPEALRLADELDDLDSVFSRTGLCGESALELRRLHAENKALNDALQYSMGCHREMSELAVRQRILLDEMESQAEQEPVGYEYVEYRPYGAPGEIRRGTILLEHYRNADGAIAGDWEWLVQQFKTSKNTISMRPLYTHPQPKCEPLTDGQIDAIADAMPGGLEGFLKGWGWRQFARAVLESANSTK